MALPRFSYTSTTRSGQRRLSFCIFSATATEATHVRDKRLGFGSYGSVSLMKPIQAEYKPIAVKEFTPPTSFNVAWTDDQIKAYIHQSFNFIKEEARFNYLLNNVGAYFSIDEAIVIKLQGDKKIVESYPRCYVAMEYIDGVIFHDFKIDAGEKYLKICIATLSALRELHTQFIHGDIKNNNLFVCEDKNNNYIVRFIDFTLSRFPGKSLPVGGLNLKVKPPEFKGKKLIDVDVNQDVYCTGLMLKSTFKPSLLYYPQLIRDIHKIHDQMMAYKPEDRITVDEALGQFKSLLLKSNELLGYWQKLIALREKLEGEVLSSTNNIDKWCYCERFIYQIFTRDEGDKIPHEQFVSFVRTGYEKLTNAKLQWTKRLGAIRLKEKAIEEAEDVIYLVKEIHNSNNRIEFLKHMSADTGWSFFVNLFKKIEDLKSLLALVSSEHKKDIYLLWFKSKQMHLEKQEFSQVNLDKWCYCVKNLRLLEETVNVDTALLGCKNLMLDNWTTGYGVKRLKEMTLQKGKDLLEVLAQVPDRDKDSFIKLMDRNFITALRDYEFNAESLKKFAALVDASYDIDCTDRIIKAYAKQLIDNNGGFCSALRIVDSFDDEKDHALYKRILIKFNQIYYDKRSEDKNEYYSLFGIFPRQTKLRASNGLEDIANHREADLNDFEETALCWGDLGEVATRILRVV